MKKLLMMVLIAGLTVSVPATTWAGGHHSKKSGCSKCAAKAKTCKIGKLKKKMKMYWMYKDHLELSDEQLDQIAGIKHDAMKKMIQYKADADIVKVDLMTELWEEQIDAGNAQKLVSKKYAAKEKLAKTFVKALADAQAVLESNQRAKMKDLKLQKYLNKGDCAKCALSGGGKICPLTGKSLGMKGSSK